MKDRRIRPQDGKIVPDFVVNKVWEYLKATDPMAKTIVFAFVTSFTDCSKKPLRVLLTLCRFPTMATDEPRMSAQTLKVLGTLMASPQDELSGAEIGRIAKLPSGTLYPIVLRLEGAGWLASRWETEDPHALGRPRRRFYWVTPVGARKAREAFRELEPAFGRPSWA
jgi:PadR family transcriptional regulator, regulatory protein PadR